MITKTNFKNLLKTLGFTEEGNTFQKSISEADLKVDFSKQSIIYPEDRGLIVNRRDTCNFSQPENFVVFECVHRLLEKGYKPEHLELEPTWRIGHGASGGRADILVRDQENNPLLIIECKTAGDEFERAWRKTEQNGDQLFSYAQQIPQTQYLCLYASDFVDKKIRIDQKIIAHRDNEKIIAQNERSRRFSDATDIEDRFSIWCDTYELECTESGIFEENIQTYHIGKNKYTLAADTKPIDAADAKKDGKYHDFRTILRKHNIARREQAFEVLVNLFLCKLVDEEDNKTDLQFSWKGIAYDNYFDYIDRLQNLYRTGMDKFLGKNISYVSNEEIEKAFWAIKSDPDATKKQIQNYFRKLKFFTNSAFSLQDTHNEELFKRNAKVLLEIVQMWQGIRLKTNAQNPFLGEMFELFLDDGVKQSEGQYFTPLPICKFIVASLPLKQKIKEKAEPLKAIDYACGSGHFLNEYAYQIKSLVEKQERDRYYSHITGIEKEDRLAKVAKVAAYMHGQEQIKILDADALAPHTEIQRESYDILVANPPFAVKEFLHTLSKETKREYQLIQATGEDSDTNTIQCFFLERIYHLMAPDGIVGVIVPSSILSNTDAVHIRTREILLQYFNFVCIAELGSGTFGKTGTNTVVLFLRRKERKPEAAEHYRNRVNGFFEGDCKNAKYKDNYLIKAYCKHIEVPYEEYIKLFAPTNIAQLTKLFQYDIFQDYKQTFNQSTKIKNLKKSNAFKKKTPTERSAKLEQLFIEYLHEIEKDKLYYFILAHTQAGKVLIVKAPKNKKEQAQFLGYKWSEAKGREGIQYNDGDTVNDIITALFDPKDLDNDTKINTAIKRNFIGEITDPLSEHCHYAKLADMLNFSRVDFDKVIRLNPPQDIETQYPLVKLGDKIETIESGNRPEGGVGNISSGAWSLGGEHIHPTTGRVDLSTPKYVPLEFYHGSSRGILQENDIVLCKDGALTGKIALLRKELNDEKAMINEHVFLLRCSSQVKQYYIFHFLFSENGQNLLKQNITGSAQGGINSTNLKEMKIPLPPLDVQKQIVNECNIVDKETDQAKQAITAAKQEIEKKLQAVINVGYEMKKIGDIFNTTSGGTPLSSKREYYKNGTIPWINSGEVSKKEINFADHFITESGLNNSNAKLFPPGTVLLAMYGATAGKVSLLSIEAATNQALCALLPTEEMVPKFLVLVLESMYQYLLNLRTGIARDNLSQEKIRNIRIPVPPLDIQQQLVGEVEQLEAKITQAQTVIDNATERKNAILAKYL